MHLVQVISLAAGNGMLYARTRRGYTFAWGCGSQGQLGVVSLFACDLCNSLHRLLGQQLPCEVHAG